MVDAIKILGSLMGNNAVSSGLGAQVLKSVLGGALGGGSGAGASGSGLGGLLGGVLGSGGSSGGGLLGGLAEAALKQFGQNQAGSPAPASSEQCMPEGMNQQQANEEATLLIRAMINAAKADGRVDREETENVLQRLGDITQDEIDFVRQELAQPLDVEGFIRSVPRGMEQQVYAMSLLAIDLDTNPEAKYLHQLAQGLRMSQQVCNQIHQQLGAPQLYS